jgi:Protein of unknown function (DUF3224)
MSVNTYSSLVRINRGKLLPAATFLLMLLAGLASAPAGAQSVATNPSAIPQGTSMTLHISGEFDVKLTPQPPTAGEPVVPGRMLIDKQFRGALAGSSSGQMLAVQTDVKGSAGYVAMERFKGVLGERAGSFALQHSGTMDRGAPTLTITVVPDSGGGQLRGLSGTMKINIVDGKHFYEFDYNLPDAP